MSEESESIMIHLLHVYSTRCQKKVRACSRDYGLSVHVNFRQFQRLSP